MDVVSMSATDDDELVRGWEQAATQGGREACLFRTSRPPTQACTPQPHQCKVHPAALESPLPYPSLHAQHRTPISWPLLGPNPMKTALLKAWTRSPARRRGHLFRAKQMATACPFCWSHSSQTPKSQRQEGYHEPDADPPAPAQRSSPACDPNPRTCRKLLHRPDSCACRQCACPWNHLTLNDSASPCPPQMVEEDDVLDGLEERMSAISDAVQPPFGPSSQGPRSGEQDEDDRPVARRTRAQAPLHHMSIEELEALLQVRRLPACERGEEGRGRPSSRR